MVIESNFIKSNVYNRNGANITSLELIQSKSRYFSIYYLKKSSFFGSF